MTTEIAILNQSAVALAADSAVTVTSGNGLKVYDGVNKLFELIKGRPVGVMIYNSADLDHRPWETIIKTYREERCAESFATLDEYVHDFLNFITTHKQLFSARQQEESLTSALVAEATVVRNYVLQALQDKWEGQGRRRPTDRQVSAIVNREVQDYWEWVHKTFALDQWSIQLPTETKLRTSVRTLVDAVLDDVFQQLPMKSDMRSKMRTAMVKRVFGYSEAAGDYSGVVFAGFGDDEYYPRLREFRAKALFTDRLLFQEIDDTKVEITAAEPGAIRSFAQGDMIRSFTDGIQDQVRMRMVEYWAEWADEGGRSAITNHTSLSHLAPADLKKVADVLGTFAHQSVGEFFHAMADYEREVVRGPLIQSVAFLPKDEMGAMAESLVNLTTLKRKVTIDEAQTVGGAVDVAVVSRGDGFVWLKRKHYFDPTLNPNWASQHSGVQRRMKEQ